MQIFCLEDEIGQLPRSAIVDALSTHTLTIAKSCEEAKQKYVGPYDILLLDHDMEGNYEYRPDFPNTGMQFVKWLVEQPTHIHTVDCGSKSLRLCRQSEEKPQVILHSHNPTGRRNMKLLLEDYGYHVVEMPFNRAYVEFLRTV